MVSGPDDDFANFLEFGDLQLNFPAFDQEAQDGRSGQQSSLDGLDTNIDNGVGMMAMKGGEMPLQIDPSLTSMQTSASDLQDLHGSSESLMDMNMQAQLFHQQQMHYHQQRLIEGHYHRQGMVPPTPNSLEMHGQPRSWPQLDPQSRAMYEHYARKQQDQVRRIRVSPIN